MKSLHNDATITTHEVMSKVLDYIEKNDVYSEELNEQEYYDLLNSIQKIIRTKLDETLSEGYAECYKDILGTMKQ